MFPNVQIIGQIYKIHKVPAIGKAIGNRRRYIEEDIEVGVTNNNHPYENRCT